MFTVFDVGKQVKRPSCLILLRRKIKRTSAFYARNDYKPNQCKYFGLKDRIMFCILAGWNWVTIVAHHNR